MNPIKIGVFGSAFNPPTLGHMDVLRQASVEFDLILLVPSASHAFAKKLQPFRKRVGMLHCFLKEVQLPDCPLEICTLEAELFRQSPDKPVYTFDLMEALEQHHKPPVQLGFIRGPDNVDPENWYRFYKAQEIEQRWNLFNAQERLVIRSSYVRELIASAESDDNKYEVLERLLLPSVRDYIFANKLYQS